MDKRLTEINFRLSEYSKGRFDGALVLSEELDEVDAIMNGINMLGEELKAITISRDYFNKIFQAVSDMILIVSPGGIIKDVNHVAEQQLEYEKGALYGLSLSQLLKGNMVIFKKLFRQLRIITEPVSVDTMLFTKSGGAIHVRINAAPFKDENKKQLILITASDITFRVKTENMIIRAIIDTQEKERHRLAQDLHDSLSQQLSAIKFYVSATAAVTKDKKQKKILDSSSSAMNEVMADMRNICFNLMPGTLAEFGLVKAVKEFCNYSLFCKKTRFIIKQNVPLPNLTPELKIDLYRVIQEFINNAIKHGQAGRIIIAFRYLKQQLLLQLTDDGCGFNLKLAGKGMGLQNVQSRVRSHNGKLEITSEINKGTNYKIAIPLNNMLQ